MSMNSIFRTMPHYPDSINGINIFIRLIDGLGFRFYWATEGLRPEDYEFKPGEGIMTIEELIRHNWGLVNWINGSLTGKYENTETYENIMEIRDSVLTLLLSIRVRLVQMTDDELKNVKISGQEAQYPFWNMINGPLSDALTHTGQINSFRRLAGNPSLNPNVFLGQPPSGIE